MLRVDAAVNKLPSYAGVSATAWLCVRYTPGLNLDRVLGYFADTTGCLQGGRGAPPWSERR